MTSVSVEQAGGAEVLEQGGVPTLVQVMEATRRSIRLFGEGRSTLEASRVAELLRAGGDHTVKWTTYKDAKGYKDYVANVTSNMTFVPRYWIGWEVAGLPAAAADPAGRAARTADGALKNYWRAWLQPELPTNAFVHPQSREAVDYWKRTHDWRGRASFFRDGYNYAVSTQNFNHTAADGRAAGRRDDRLGIRHGRRPPWARDLPLRFWSFLDGSTQELLDHYYLSITLSAQKMFADFGPTPIDRLMGRILVDRTMELLITRLSFADCRRFLSSAGRARICQACCSSRTASTARCIPSPRKAPPTMLDRPADSFVHGMPLWGYDFPPGRVAIQSLPSPWAPSWMAGLIDDKPVPFEHTSTETTRGNFKPPLWRRSWLGRWHGLASNDIKGGSVDVLAQWVRAPKKAERIEDLGTLTVRYHANKPDLATTGEGVYSAAGLTLTYQSRNRAIVFAKPHSNRERLLRGIKGDLAQLATVIGLWNFSPTPDWELFVDGQKITAFPHRMTSSQRLLIRDGVTYLAILPLPASNLGRDAEIEIGPGGGGRGDFSREDIAPALIVSMFNMKRATGVPAKDLDLDKIMTQTYGGFVLEMGDAEQHGSFEAFAEHIKTCQLTATWQEREKRLEVSLSQRRRPDGGGLRHDFGQPAEMHFAIDPGSAGNRHPLPQTERAMALPATRPRARHDVVAAGHDRPAREERRGPGHRARSQGLPAGRSVERRGRRLQSAARSADVEALDQGRRGVRRRRQARPAARRVPSRDA